MKRRAFLGSAAAGAGAFAIEPFQRGPARFSGLALTAYSLRSHLRWWLGRPTGTGTMEMMDFLEYGASLGLEGVELTSYFFRDPLAKSDLHALRRRAHLLGLDICGGAMGNNFAWPPGSEENRAHMAYARSWIDRFADLGAPVVRVFAGRRLPPGAGPDEVIANVTANLGEALAHAEKRGVMLGLENHDFARNIDYLMRIIGAIDSSWLGVVWDSANLDPTPDPYAELGRIAPYAVTAQVKVMTEVDGKDVPADYGRLVRILRDADYRGYLVFEYEEKEDPLTAIPGHLEKLRELL